MKGFRYRVYLDGTLRFYSNSRNSKKHLNNHGGNRCEVYTKSMELVSMAFRDANDCGKIKNGYVPR